MSKFRVEMTTLARMRGFIDVEADDACAAEDKALERSGDVPWKYEGACEGAEGPQVQHVHEISDYRTKEQRIAIEKRFVDGILAPVPVDPA